MKMALLVMLLISLLSAIYTLSSPPSERSPAEIKDFPLSGNLTKPWISLKQVLILRHRLPPRPHCTQELSCRGRRRVRCPGSCQIEYQVEECSPEDRATNKCIHVKTTKAFLPRGGDVVFGVAHQHSGGSGSSLHGQDGRLLCESLPTYGTGKKAGKEANYIGGMSTCYPKPGSVKVSDGEVLTVVSNYSSNRRHTGAMGLFYILVAETTVIQFTSSMVLTGMDV